ncbi:MAG: His-Xaa-Ser system protein HxsD [Candidatus Paceibacterota bacterium]
MRTITLDTNIYSLRSILSTSFVFLDDYYIFLDQTDKEKITVQIKSKEKNGDLEKAVNEFKNELISTNLRLKISEENRKIRELIVSSALYGRPTEKTPFRDPEGISKTWEEKHRRFEKVNDPEGICKVWEEKHRGFEKVNDPEGISKTWQENQHRNPNIHKAVNKGCSMANKPEYTNMFKEQKDGDKSK